MAVLIYILHHVTLLAAQRPYLFISYIMLHYWQRNGRTYLYLTSYYTTGSTAAALIYILHHVTLLLETNEYVRCLLIDFSKAFDTVNHFCTY